MPTTQPGMSSIAEDLAKALREAKLKPEASDQIMILTTAIIKARQAVLQIQSALRGWF